ncbi:DUF1905 domain-containing protein [Microlunatus elymi]|uniref:DUF1905 domain-containing protein n=1 Tax=Microlunatus elymi TaxID=2596828 RepID=A0A516Q052_9ACTN|nr:DUF1905 domain-containing protein [Microlunatus elymi]QDP96819.1 DUF1905 domain-containing protein [Microlunatus elymi]
MDFEFSGPIWYWRGPSPFYFVSVPDEESLDIADQASALTYGWGVIPVRATIGATEFETSLFPKDGLYALPIKLAVRRAEGLGEGDVVSVRMSTVGPN